MLFLYLLNIFVHRFQNKFQKINAKNIFVSGASLLLVVCCIVFRITKSVNKI